jgi:hypothetical protein
MSADGKSDTTPAERLTKRARDYIDASNLARAEEFVRDELRMMGQPLDAENPELVKRVALRIAANMRRP